MSKVTFIILSLFHSKNSLHFINDKMYLYFIEKSSPINSIDPIN